jgi:5'-deoxynucleotidase YfbR-like HD superfamily hydrolase
VTNLTTAVTVPEGKRGGDWLRGDYMSTFSGGKFYPGDPRASEVFIKDIAHALSNLARFAGHTRRFYSVAQHSLLVSLAVPEKDALAGLLHDATEAYVVDVPRPVKYLPGMEVYREIEGRIRVAIVKRFKLPADEPDSVKAADVFAVAAEKRDLFMTPPTLVIKNLPAPFDEVISPLRPHEAKKLFLGRFFELVDKAKAVAQEAQVEQAAA